MDTRKATAYKAFESIGNAKPMFASDEEAKEFCERVYRETGGVTPALQQAYEFYLKNFMPTEKEFRDAGYTAAAINFPLSDCAFTALCAYNGITTDRAPRAWRYAPNAAVQNHWERIAAPHTRDEALEGPLSTAIGQGTPPETNVGLGTDAQQAAPPPQTQKPGPFQDREGEEDE